MTLDIDTLLSELTLDEKASLTRARRSGTPRRSTASASRRSWCPTARTGCAPSPGRATTSASAGQPAGDLLPDGVGDRLELEPGTAAPDRRGVGAGGARLQPVRHPRPGINMKRSPLCGRNFEYFSEDPYLAGELAVGDRRRHPVAGRRHVGQALRREQPGDDRLRVDAQVDERTLREIYLPAFERVVTAMPAVDDHVLLQQGQRGVGVREPLAADHRPARGVGLPGAGRLRLGRGLPPGTRAARRAGPGDAARPGAQPRSDRRRRASPGRCPTTVLDTRVRTVLELVAKGMPRARAR